MINGAHVILYSVSSKPEDSSVAGPGGFESVGGTPVTATAIPAAAAAPGLEPASQPIAWSAWSVDLFFAGAWFGIGYLMLGGFLLWRTLARGRPAPEWLDRLCDELRAGAGIDRKPRLHVTDCASPFCFDFVGARIALPEYLCRPSHREQIKHVILHELAHVHQRDGRGRLLFAVALPLLWFHPLFWWIRARARFACEAVADDLAARWSDKAQYARQLLQLASMPSGGRAFAPLAAGVTFSNHTQFYKRIEMLMNRRDRLPTRCSRLRSLTQTLVTVAVVVGPAAVWGAEPVAAQDRPAKKPTKNEQKKDVRAEIRRLRARIAELEGEVARFPKRSASVVVQKGDSLRSIVLRYHGRGQGDALMRVVSFNMRANPGFDGTKLQVGQRILLPAIDPKAPNPLEVIAALAKDRRNDQKTVAANSPADESPAVSVPRSDPLRSSVGSSATSVDAYVLDLITRAIDLDTEYEIAVREFEGAKRSLKLLESPSKAEVVQAETALEIADIKTRRAKRKAVLIGAVIRSEIDSTQSELRRAVKLRKIGRVDSSKIRRLENRLKILEMAK